MNWEGRRVFITGVTGFIGSYLAKYLIDSKASVYGFMRRRADGELPNNLKRHRLEGSLHLLEGDLVEATSLASALDVSQPEIVFHLAAQSYVPRSFQNPAETFQINTVGTANLLEAIRGKGQSPTIVFAGSSEEYGLVLASQRRYKPSQKRLRSAIIKDVSIPELPIREENPLRPMSPYAVSKVQGDYMMRNYWQSFGLKTIVSRAFNTEGAGRGPMFVTSTIAQQVANLVKKRDDKIVIGNVNVFRDWSHVSDIVCGFCLLAENGVPGEVYNLGSQRTNSVLTYILLALEAAGFHVSKLESFKNGKQVHDPLTIDESPLFNMNFEKTRVDVLLMQDETSYTLEDEGIWVETDRGRLPIYFDPARFRVQDVPVLLSETSKAARLGFHVEKRLKEIILEQVNQYLGVAQTED